MELEIIRKLREKFGELEAEMRAMPADSRFERIRKNEKCTFNGGFGSALDLVEEIVGDYHKAMARDYGEES
jgi:hypothetical protein